VNVTVENKGDLIETFIVTAYAANVTGSYVIGEQQTTLNPAETMTLTFTWTTTGYAYGNYTVWAYAWPVPGETDTTDNNLTDGWVVVSMLGDLTGGTPNPWDFVPDGKVSGVDVSVVSRCFGSWPEAQPPIR